MLQYSLRKAQEDAASLTPEYVAANMSPQEAERLRRVRNIGIAVSLRQLPAGNIAEINTLRHTSTAARQP